IDIIDGAVRAEGRRELIPAFSPMSVTASRRHCREEVEACETARGTRGTEIGACAFQILVFRERIVHEVIELGIMEQRPESRLDLAAAEAGLADIDELRRHGRDRPLIVGSNCASAQCCCGRTDDAADERLTHSPELLRCPW